MPDPTNDIDALSAFLLGQPAIGPRWHAALTDLIAERDALRKRVAELEARAKPVYITDGQRVESIDLRERLVCAALTGLCADPSLNGGNVGRLAIGFADETLAAMRKGEADAK